MKTPKQIITETLGTTLINYYKGCSEVLKEYYDNPDGRGSRRFVDICKESNLCSNCQAKIRAHKQARKNELEWLKDFGKEGCMMKPSNLKKYQDRINAIQLEINFEGNEE